jgi:hypothetical protein
MRKNTMFLTSCLVGAASYLLVAAKPAEARYKRITGSDCTIDLQTYSTARLNSDGFVNTANSNTQKYTTCTIADDDVFPHHQAVTMNVHLYDGTSGASVDVYACVTYNGALGGLCGIGASSGAGFTGVTSVSPPISVLQNHEYDFPHLWANVPGYNSSIKGIFLRDW